MDYYFVFVSISTNPKLNNSTLILLHKLIFHQFDNTIIKLFKIVPSTIELLKQILYFRNIYSNNNLPQIKFKLAYLSTESFKWTSKAILLKIQGKCQLSHGKHLSCPVK